MRILRIIIISGFILLVPLRGSAQQRILTSEDTLQYTLGAFVGKWMISNNLSVSDYILFKQGIEDVSLNKQLAIPDSSIVPRIAEYQLSILSEKSMRMEKQLFDELRGKEGVGALPDGVHYIILEPGNGIRPMSEDSIVFNAVGLLPDGTLFEDTYQKQQPIKNTPGNLIPGLNAAIQLMPEGSKWRIFIPSELAYGSGGVSNFIPPNSALIYEIALIEVKR